VGTSVSRLGLGEAPGEAPQSLLRPLSMNQRAPVWGGAKRMRVASAQFRAAVFYLSGRGVF